MSGAATRVRSIRTPRTPVDGVARNTCVLGLALLAVSCNPAATAPRKLIDEVVWPGPDDAEVTKAIRRAVEWSDTIDVDPIRLRRERGMKGIKHFVELLELLSLAAEWPSDRTLQVEARERARAALRVTSRDDYHDLAAADAQRFREDSMSYLRAAWLAHQLGADTTRYDFEIRELLPRFYAALPTRGVDQRMGFALLFEQLELPRPESIASIYPETGIARRLPLSWYLRSPDRPYDLTHEIFALTARGATEFDFPDPEDERFALETTRELLRRSLQAGDIDIAAELLVSLALLGASSDAFAQDARGRILRAQNPDGSFGVYDSETVRAFKGNPLYDVRIGGNLHTTLVCVWALIEARPASIGPCDDQKAGPC